jgi:hypothetical protein
LPTPRDAGKKCAVGHIIALLLNARANAKKTIWRGEVVLGAANLGPFNHVLHRGGYLRQRRRQQG